MNEYDRADFAGVYEGKSLIETAAITSVPWEIGEPQPIVCKILDSMSPGRLLDIGCGLGRNAKAASDRGYEVLAIDISSTAINKCREFYSGSGISFQVLDACRTELIPEFNVILDSATYHAIPAEKRITRWLDQLAMKYGYPQRIRVDNGPENISRHFQQWAKIQGIEIQYIQRTD
jgi:2-polyprenyl-3-methyl-5-hydroxy-6-metoxy-1,4-benzoquinol methylase